MKLQQGQVWLKDGTYIRIVHLERLAVGYKELPDLAALDGRHLQVTKKTFCRLIKGAELLSDEQVRSLMRG